MNLQSAIKPRQHAGASHADDTGGINSNDDKSKHRTAARTAETVVATVTEKSGASNYIINEPSVMCNDIHVSAPRCVSLLFCLSLQLLQCSFVLCKSLQHVYEEMQLKNARNSRGTGRCIQS